ncbi:MAG TPA: phosphonopyruvate decarboxylase [Cyclobacteriaceae bacterium]|nr:phosphonopyruvate decarboxylase [Cyclobacteriaceae bacterium]
MLSTQAFGNELKKLGYDFYSGVPCSFLKYLINYAINECDYVMAANEGDAVAIASGAYLGGKKSVVLMQNSGLTNATSPLTSLNYTFQLPVLGFVSLRGEAGLGDEPQHELMGQITEKMLKLMKVKWAYLSDDMNEAKKQLKKADKLIAKKETFFFVVKKGTFDEVKLKDQQLRTIQNKTKIKSSQKSELPTRRETLKTLVDLSESNTILLATTGKTGRELFEVADKPNHLYMVGSMGCISSLGLGLALAQPSKKVIVIDGDGSAIMRMGSFTTNAYYQPTNLLHIVLDNNTHDSTGGQATVSHNIDFVEHAASVCYPIAQQVNGLDELTKSIVKWQIQGGLTLLHLRIAKGSTKELGRPSIKPYQVKERLMHFIQQ